MNWKLLVSTFGLIFISELPDKSAFATLLMATRGNPFAVFLGVASAFLVQTGIAVSLGHLLGKFSPAWMPLVSGVLFLIFATLSLFRNVEEEEKEEQNELDRARLRGSFGDTAWKSFLLIFIAEWGDITQLATASLAARYSSPATIFAAALGALWSVTAIAIVLGNRARKSIAPNVLKRIASLAFACVGLYFILDWARAT